MIELGQRPLTLQGLSAISRGESTTLARQARVRVDKARRLVEELASGEELVYGLNTGFGYLARQRVNNSQQQKLQENILLSHASGSGPYFSSHEVRAALTLRLNSFLHGNSGVSWELISLMHALLEQGITPAVPSIGSVGASGDLIPLAHLGLPLIGKGKVIVDGKLRSSAAALKRQGLQPLTLGVKEGLSFVNGTEMMLAVGALAFVDLRACFETSLNIIPLTLEALQARCSFLDPRIHNLRPFPGQIAIAKTLHANLCGSKLLDEGFPYPRVQDPYSLRCLPQILGPVKESLDYTDRILNIELNAVTDNPLVFECDRVILSGGNFHGEYLALTFDQLALAICEVGAVLDRRIELLVNPYISGLPSFLTPHPGENSGYMAAQYLSASLVNENRHLAMPACTDTIPGNVGIEDFVSMGMTCAKKLRNMVTNLQTLVAIEYVVAGQALWIGERKDLTRHTKRLLEMLREYVPPLKRDRVIAEDIAKSRDILFPAAAS